MQPDAVSFSAAFDRTRALSQFVGRVAAAKPALSSAAKNQSSTLTGWTTAVTAGDIIRINVDPTPASVTKVTLVLEITRSQ